MSVDIDIYTGLPVSNYITQKFMVADVNFIVGMKLFYFMPLFWETESPFEQGYEIPLSHVVKGFYIAGKFFIAISRDKPIHWLERSRVRESKNNIYDLQQFRMRKKQCKKLR